MFMNFKYTVCINYEDRGSMFLQNASNHLPGYSVIFHNTKVLIFITPTSPKSANYSKPLILHFCWGPPKNGIESQKVLNPENIVLMGIWLAPYKSV